MRLISCLKNDIRLQFRQGFYTIYLVITLLYIFILRALPETIQNLLRPLIIFTDPAVLGFFFIGGMILLEKEDRIIQNLFVTPLAIAEYILSKVLSLGLISLLSSLAIGIFTGNQKIHYPSFCMAVLLTSLFFTLTGMAAVCRFNTINKYLVLSVSFIFPLFLPLLWYFDWLPSFPFVWMPTYASLKVLRLSLSQEMTPLICLFGFLSLGLWSFIAVKLVTKWFQRFIVEKTGDKE